MCISEAATILRWFSGAHLMRSSGHIQLSLLDNDRGIFRVLQRLDAFQQRTLYHGVTALSLLPSPEDPFLDMYSSLVLQRRAASRNTL
jgi:hypothetical protein